MDQPLPPYPEGRTAEAIMPPSLARLSLAIIEPNGDNDVTFR